MTCTEWREIASDYLEKTLSPELQGKADAHVRGCASCQADVSALKSLARVLSAPPDVDPPLFFAENIRAKIETQQKDRRAKFFWPSLGRLAFGTAIMGATGAAVLFTLLTPGQNDATLRTAGIGPRGTVAATPTLARVPRLSLQRTLRAGADEPMMEFGFRMENAPTGAVRVDIPGDPHPYRFVLSDSATRPLQVPLSVARGQETLALSILWNAGDESGRRFLAIPLPRTDAAPPAQLAFALRDLPIHDAIRELARRFGQDIVLENVSPDIRLAFDARNETLAQTLDRHLKPLGLSVVSIPGGVQVNGDYRVNTRVPSLGESR